MKKLIIIISFLLLSVAAIAQSRTRTTVNMGNDATYYSFALTAAVDMMNGTTYDTLRYPIFVNKDYPVLFYFNSVLKGLTATDTTVTINVYGKVFASQAWSIISSCTSTTSAVTVAGITTATSLLTEPASTGTIIFDTTKFATKAADRELYYAATASGKTAIANYYRYIMIEFIITGNDALGTGVKLTTLDVKFFRRYF